MTELFTISTKVISTGELIMDHKNFTKEHADRIKKTLDINLDDSLVTSVTPDNKRV